MSKRKSFNKPPSIIRQRTSSKIESATTTVNKPKQPSQLDYKIPSNHPDIASVDRQLGTSYYIIAKLLNINVIDRTLSFISIYILNPVNVISISTSLILVIIVLIYLNNQQGYVANGIELVIGFFAGWCIGLVITALNPIK